MKTPKVVYLSILLSFLISGCMPDSFTKFKEDPAQTQQGSEAPPPTVEDPTLDDGSSVDFSNLDMPTVYGYSLTPGNPNTQTFVFEVGIDVSENLFNATGQCGMRPIVDGTFDDFFCDDVESASQAQEEQASIADALDFSFKVAPTIGSSEAIGHPCPNPAGISLPTGLILSETTGLIEGRPLEITSDSVTGPTYGLPYPINLALSFTNATLTTTTLCTTIKVAAYEVPTGSGFNYQQSNTLRLRLTNFIGQGTIAAFEVGDFITSVDPDGAGPSLAGSGTVIFVDAPQNEIIVQKTSGDFIVGIAVDDENTYLAPEADIEAMVNVFQTSTTTNINVGPIGLPPTVSPPGPYENPSLGPENGVRFITNWESKPSTINFSDLTGVLSGYIQSEVLESTLESVAINPLWKGDGLSFLGDVVDPDTGAYVGNVKYTDFFNTSSGSSADLSGGYSSIGSQSEPTDYAVTETTFEITAPAVDGGFFDQYLLAVNDVTNFNPGDFISQNTCSENSDKMTVGRVIAKVDRNFPLLDYLLVQYVKGCAPTVGSNVDNSVPYSSPKATIFDVIPNSFVIETSDAAVLTWPSKEGGSADYHISARNGAKGVINLIQNGDTSPTGLADGIESGLGTSNYIFVRMTSPVDIDGDTINDKEIDNYFSTAIDSIVVGETEVDRRRDNRVRPCQVYAAPTCTTPFAAINNILAGTVEIESLTNATEINVGDTFSNNTNDAFGDIMDDEPTRIKAYLNKGFLRVGSTITDSNPYDGVLPSIIDAVTYVPTFYLKKGSYYEFPFVLDRGLGTSAFFLQPTSEPPGMETDNGDFTSSATLGGLVNEKMISTIYEATASNGAGKTSFQATFEVLEYFELTALNSASNRNTSVVLHRAGQGNQLASCGMFEAQMGVGTCSTNCGGPGCFDKLRCENDGGNWSLNNDILCYLEIGEEDLFYNGLKLKLEVTGSQCEFVSHKPFTLYKWRPGITPTPDIYTHTIPQECNETLIGLALPANYKDKPTESISTDLDGTNGIASVKARCLYENNGFDYENIYTLLSGDTTLKGPNCDEGDVQEQKINWVREGFKCYQNQNLGGALLSYTDADSCVENVGNCLGDPAQTNSTDCASSTVPGATWDFIGSHNDSTAFGAANATDGPEMNDCFREPEVLGQLVKCGGNYGACVASSYAGTGGQEQPLSIDQRRDASGVVTNLIANDQPITYNYFAPDSRSTDKDAPRNDADNNTIISNYYGEDPSCISNAPYEYNIIGQTLAAELSTNFNAIVGGFGTNSLYTYECRNASGDMKGTIRLIVRDWNQDFQNQVGFAEIDKAQPGSLINDGLDNYPDMNSAPTSSSNKCSDVVPTPVLDFSPFSPVTPALPVGFPNNKL